MSTPTTAENSASKPRNRFANVLSGAIGGWLFPYVFGGAALVCILMSYLVLDAQAVDTAPSSKTVLILVALTVLFALCAVIAQPVSRLLQARRIGLTGSRLHNRLVVLFALIAVVPTLIVAIFTAVFLELGLENWFSAEIRNSVTNSVSIAEDYFEEHKKSMQRDIAEASAVLNRKAPYLQLDRNALLEEVMDQAFLHSLSEVIILSGTGEVFVRYNFAGVGDGNASQIETLPSRAFEDAKPGVIVPIHSEADDVVQVFMKLDSFLDRYIYASRTIDPLVIEKLNQTRVHATQFSQLENERATVQLEFTMIFLAISLVVLLSAIWAGMWLANQIVAPISRLVDASDEIRGGNLSIRVAEPGNDDEIAALSRAFNSMTSQLQSQRKDLTDANDQLDQRNRFTEAVLAGVSVGIIGLNAEAEIDLLNKTALSTFEVTGEDVTGTKLADVVPELDNLVATAVANPEQFIQEQINITRQGVFKSLQVRISSERAGSHIDGFVVTIDDITKLVSAERTAAWADVARRIAHEIKNPLTPIQLSAERLNRKYLKEVSSDPDVFARCTETIIRQVGDIRRMVDEFSGFARMPAPTFSDENITEIARQTLLFLEVSSPEIEFSLDCPEQPVDLYCDGRLLAQALTNIVKNAVESITGSQDEGDQPTRGGLVELSIITDANMTTIRVSDNGGGLPVDLSEQLTEPYVTTRTKGTGLGLAIVKKIMVDHGGDVTLENQKAGGANVSLIFSHARLKELQDTNPGQNEQENLSVPPMVSAG